MRFYRHELARLSSGEFCRLKQYLPDLVLDKYGNAKSSIADKLLGSSTIPTRIRELQRMVSNMKRVASEFTLNTMSGAQRKAHMSESFDTMIVKAKRANRALAEIAQANRQQPAKSHAELAEVRKQPSWISDALAR